MKKVFVLTYSMGSGGAERVLSLLLPELMKSYDVELILMSEVIHYKLPKQLPITYLEKSKTNESGLRKLLNVIKLAIRYRRLCKQKKIDISLSFMTRPNYINVIAKLLGNDCRTIISERSMPSLEYQGNSLKSIINRFLIKTLYPFSDEIIANSMGNKRDLFNNFKVKTPINVIYNPLDKSLINSLMKEPCNFQFDKFTFITIGRLDIGKNHRMMIEAFSKIDNRDTQLIIIGEGELRENLEELIEIKGLRNRVFLVGKQKNPYKWLAKSNVFLFTSLREGFPNVILEALACELPIISTNPNGVVQEILGEEGNIITTTKELIVQMNLTQQKCSSGVLDRYSLENINKLFQSILER